MRVKKSGSHSDYLYSLEQYADLIDFNSLTKEALICHLFLEQADIEMAKLAQETLAKNPKGNLTELRSEIKRCESSVWYCEGKYKAKAAHGTRYCKECDSVTHNSEDCWGPCEHCNRRGHKTADCRNKKYEGKKAEEERKKAKRAKNKKQNEKKKEEKKQKAEEAKKAAATANTSEVLSEAESSTSEDDSPKKGMRVRQERVEMSGAARRALMFEEELRDLNEMEATILGESISKALVAKSNPSPLLKAEVFANRSMVRGRMEDLIMDTGCTKSVVGAALCRENKLPIFPVSGIKITDASGNYLNIIGSTEFYISSPQVLGNKKRRVKAAVLEGNNSDREILISLDLLVKWDLIIPNFPNQTVTNFMKNKDSVKTKYSHNYLSCSAIFEQDGLGHKIRTPPEKCKALREKIIKKYAASFKSKLSATDRMKVAPVDLIIDENSTIKPEHHTRPFDVPFHLRKAWELEIKNALEGGILEPVSYPTTWASKAFAVPKADPTKVRIVGDFRTLNRSLKRPHWPTESSGQLLRHIDPEAKKFVTIDATSGYHQIPVSKQSQKLLVIITQQGRFAYTVLPMGVCSSSDLFNLLTDGEVRWAGNDILKNMDDWLVSGRSLEEVEQNLKS